MRRKVCVVYAIFRIPQRLTSPLAAGRRSRIARIARAKMKEPSVSALSSGLSNSSYRADIDGIRAIAILSVICFHCAVPGVTGGFTGVDIFFVISGYLIGGHIFSEVRAGSFSFLRFYWRRAKRILPAFYGVLAFVLLAALLLLSPLEAMKTAQSAVAATLSASNIAFWSASSYFAPASELRPLLMTWSLGVEEQFYLVIPILLVLLARIRRSWILPAVLISCGFSFLLAWFELGYYSQNVFYLLPERAWELGVGVGLAVAELTGRRIRLNSFLTQLASLAGVGLLLAPLFLLDSRTLFPGAAALPSVLGTALVIALPSAAINRRLLSLPPLVFVGRISYSLYLWHWPLLAFLRVVSGGAAPRGAAWLTIPAAFAAAALSYFFIEQPFRRSTREPAPLLIRYGIVSAVFLAAWAAVWLSHGLRQRFAQLDRVEHGAAYKLASDPCLVTLVELPASPLCDDRFDARPAVAIWGDSHAAALAQGLRTLAESRGYGFVELERTSCTALTGAANFQPAFDHEAAECMAFNRKALSLLNSDPRIKIVILAGQWASSFQQKDVDRWLTDDSVPQAKPLTDDAAGALFVRSLRATIQSLRQAGKEVIVLADAPTFDLDPIFRIRAAQIPARRALARWMGAESASDPGLAPFGNAAAVAIANAQLRKVVEGVPGVQLIDLKAELCRTNDQCLYRDGDRAFYSNADHLSVVGARFILRDFHLPQLAASGK